MITIFTPTYNRRTSLEKLYESLLLQTSKNFEWVIVDDGSTDDTFSYLKKIEAEKKIPIRFQRQENSGKHIAFNQGVKMSKKEIFFCVDSDDTIDPLAVEKIIFYAKKYENNARICGFCFLKGYDSNHPVTSYYRDKEFIENYNTYIINQGFPGDKCEVFYTNILKQYPFPKLGNEKFLAEGFLWSRIARKYDTVFVNEILYYCAYLEDGLSKSGRKLRIQNPYAGMYHAYEYLDSCYNFKVRAKNMLLFLTYARFANYKGKEKRGFLKAVFMIPSVILFYYWKEKYGD